ncbi:LAMI_0A06480g1_1 [Lachancea mirantina]|uniref:LAMI_0A06480g1_1 n=1 Tax=Lachancea mirantina TaxID=1230905 RepID=A0A1G4IQN2_9SACH|nr:LAMI_0A06480g1_1 [Lachancea mirantina]
MLPSSRGMQTKPGPKRLRQSRFTVFQGSKLKVPRSKFHMAHEHGELESLVGVHSFAQIPTRGRKWWKHWGQLVETFCAASEARENRLTSKSQSRIAYELDEIKEVRRSKSTETRAALELMECVNTALSAPHDENSFWSGVSESEYEASTGKAFVYVRRDRAIGIVTVECLNLSAKRGRWMLTNGCTLVPNVCPVVKLGISRIWVCQTARGQGIAAKLLEAARKFTLPDQKIAKWEMAWSQPSESGLKLATKYNSVRHEKSGQMLIPCYI